MSTSNSVEATVRMAGNLGFETYVVSDATFTFDKRDLSGRLFAAEDVHALALANMHGEYASVVDLQAPIHDHLQSRSFAVTGHLFVPQAEL